MMKKNLTKAFVLGIAASMAAASAVPVLADENEISFAETAIFEEETDSSDELLIEAVGESADEITAEQIDTQAEIETAAEVSESEEGILLASQEMPILAAGETLFDAEKIDIEKTIHGKVKDDQDDWYKITTYAKDGLSYRVTLYNRTTVNNISFMIYDKDGNSLYETFVTRNNAPAGGSARWDFNGRGNSTYYIQVYYNNGNQTEAGYALHVTCDVTPDKGAISKVKAGSKQLTVKYKKKEYATSYKIAYRVKGGSWKYINNGSKLSRTITGLKSGKTYQVKVCALRTVNGAVNTGAWSGIKSVKVK